MIHQCRKCGQSRDCGCGECGNDLFETCADCNNTITLPIARKYNIPLSELGLDVLGGYHITEANVKKYNIVESDLKDGYWK